MGKMKYNNTKRFKLKGCDFVEGFLRALYDYAQDERVSAFLETREYQRAIYDLEENWISFRSGLTVEQGRMLDALLAREQKIGWLEEEAVFCCGLSFGVGLGRL